MPSKRIVAEFPSDVSIIHCAVSDLTLKEYIPIHADLLLSCSNVITNALKTLNANQEIAFETPNAAFYIEKNLGDISAQIAITGLLISSVEKAMAIENNSKLSAEFITALEKELLGLTSKSFFSSDILSSGEKHLSLFNGSSLNSEIVTFNSEKCFAMLDCITRISDMLLCAVEKGLSTIEQAEQFSSSVKTTIAYFRKFSDIDNLTFADIDDWDMTTFDMITI